MAATPQNNNRPVPGLAPRASGLFQIGAINVSR
jgi:hypothetical protein